jgi:hypothetical protein
MLKALATVFRPRSEAILLTMKPEVYVPKAEGSSSKPAPAPVQAAPPAPRPVAASPVKEPPAIPLLDIAPKPAAPKPAAPMELLPSEPLLAIDDSDDSGLLGSEWGSLEIEPTQLIGLDDAPEPTAATADIGATATVDEELIEFGEEDLRLD